MKHGDITPNIFLSKPSLEDIASVLDLNYNSDIIDKLIKSLQIELDCRVTVKDSVLSGNVTATHPDANVPGERGQVATTDWTNRQIGVKEIKVIKDRSELPVTGTAEIIYILKNEEGFPELIWDNKTLSFIEHE